MPGKPQTWLQALCQSLVEVIITVCMVVIGSILFLAEPPTFADFGVVAVGWVALSLARFGARNLRSKHAEQGVGTDLSQRAPHSRRAVGGASLCAGGK